MTLLGVATAVGGARGLMIDTSYDDEWMAGSFSSAVVWAGVGLFVVGVLSFACVLQRE